MGRSVGSSRAIDGSSGGSDDFEIMIRASSLRATRGVGAAARSRQCGRSSSRLRSWEWLAAGFAVRRPAHVGAYHLALATVLPDRGVEVESFYTGMTRSAGAA